MIKSRTVLKAITATVALTLWGCALQPVPVTEAERQQRVQLDVLKLYSGQEALSGPLSLSDAIARAVKYNMDYRVRLMEQAVALGQRELSTFDLLPKLTMSAGYTARNNDAFGFGFNESGVVAANPSASSERNIQTAGIDFAWSVLDFGLSYVRAKQLADQSLIAEENRRKALQNLVNDVRQAWWRAESAQKLLPQINTMLNEIQASAARARLIEARRLLPPLQIVAYRRSLLDLEQQLSLRQQELIQAQVELASLLNLPPGTQAKLTEVDDSDLELPELTANIQALEMLALTNRPELAAEDYKSRVTDREWQKQVLSLFPNFGLDVNSSYTSNKYLLNDQWTTAGYNFSFGLLKLFSLPAARRANEAQKAADESRRLGVAAGIVGQTRMAAVRYQLLTQEFDVWYAASSDDARIVQYLNSATETGLDTELELIRAKGRAMISKAQRDIVYANTQAAMGRLYNSVGLDSLPREVNNRDTAVLARLLKSKIEQWEKDNFTERLLTELAPIAFDKIELPTDAIEPFESAMNRVLRLSKIAVVKTADFKLSVGLKLESPQSGGQPAVLVMKLTDLSGKVVASGEQKSMLISPGARTQWDALGESAAYRMVEPLLKVLRRTVVVGSDGAVSSKTESAPEQKAAGAPAGIPGGVVVTKAVETQGNIAVANAVAVQGSIAATKLADPPKGIAPAKTADVSSSPTVASTVATQGSIATTKPADAQSGTMPVKSVEAPSRGAAAKPVTTQGGIANAKPVETPRSNAAAKPADATKVVASLVMTEELPGAAAKASAAKELSTEAANAPNSIQSIDVALEAGGNAVVRIALKRALARLPTGFSTDNPPRLAIDFPGTVTELSKYREIGNSILSNLSIVQAAGTTRLVMNLIRPVAHDASIQGSSIVITLRPASEPVASVSARAASAGVDLQGQRQPDGLGLRLDRSAISAGIVEK